MLFDIWLRMLPLCFTSTSRPFVGYLACQLKKDKYVWDPCEFGFQITRKRKISITLMMSKQLILLPKSLAITMDLWWTRVTLSPLLLCYYKGIPAFWHAACFLDTVSASALVWDYSARDLTQAEQKKKNPSWMGYTGGACLGRGCCAGPGSHL